MRDIFTWTTGFLVPLETVVDQACPHLTVTTEGGSLPVGSLEPWYSFHSYSPPAPPCLLDLLICLSFLNVFSLLEELWAIPSFYPPNNASRDCSWEDERFGNTGFGGRLTSIQEPPEISHVIAISLPGESQGQAGSQLFFVWSFHNSILFSPCFFSLCRSLLNLESVLLFHLSSYFPTKTGCFPYCAFGLGWELLLLSMTNTIFSLIKTIQNQQNVKCVCKAERLFFDFYLFVGSTGAPHS